MKVETTLSKKKCDWGGIMTRCQDCELSLKRLLQFVVGAKLKAIKRSFIWFIYFSLTFLCCHINVSSSNPLQKAFLILSLFFQCLINLGKSTSEFGDDPLPLSPKTLVLPYPEFFLTQSIFLHNLWNSFPRVHWALPSQGILYGLWEIGISNSEFFYKLKMCETMCESRI